MQEAKVSNPNDFKVVKFTNKNDFAFTPEMGCMYDSRPIFGITGAPGINGGESLVLPYHIGHRLAINLAKIVQVRRAPLHDEPNNPVGRPLWSTEELDTLKSSYIEELYSESSPAKQTETELLMAKVEEYRKMTEELLAKQTPVSAPVSVVEVVKTAETIGEPSQVVEPTKEGFMDKKEVIAELEKRGIQHDKRKSKADLEKLLSPVPAES